MQHRNNSAYGKKKAADFSNPESKNFLHHRKLKRLRGKSQRLDRLISLAKHKKRGSENRVTFHLGLLVYKAGLHQESDELLYGLLLDAAKKMSSTQASSYKQQ